ncbi:MAG: heme-copper oxidase subunit III, partial [Acidobacteria bacterium]|nr:heme-copper oxidase subunit III [Acidobacteriota bacterium]
FRQGAADSEPASALRSYAPGRPRLAPRTTMSDVVTAIDVTGTKIERAKLMMGFFLASEFVFFAFLILAYVDFQATSVFTGPTAASSLNPGRMGMFSAFLWASSGTIWLAEKNLKAQRDRMFRFWLAATSIFGFIFLYGEAMEYRDLLNKGVDINTNLFGTTFFTLTGFHAFHLFIGEILMLTVLGIAFFQRLRGKRAVAMESIAIYWHFVDTMWIFIFSVIYLWSAAL